MRVPSGNITTQSPFGKPLATLLDHLVDGVVTGAAIDGNGMQQPDAPADEGQPQQLALQDPDLAREDHADGQGLPGRGVLPQRDVVVGGNVLPTLDGVVQAAQSTSAP